MRGVILSVIPVLPVVLLERLTIASLSAATLITVPRIIGAASRVAVAARASSATTIGAISPPVLARMRAWRAAVGAIAVRTVWVPPSLAERGPTMRARMRIGGKAIL